ncbi:MAG: Tad domain-containing protein [Phycisphaerae bacterium]|nr:Tad domain-containing protein [Phycisphaerae bacterium]
MAGTRRCTRPARGGQVLVLTLLAMTLLVALIFYVYNVGDQVNRRTALQNVADATAISGAGWIARSMNVIAMNNCEQSRLAALVPIMDALPLACQMSGDELTEWASALAAQLARGVPQTKGDHLRTGIESLRARMAAQRDILVAADAALNDGSFDMEMTTHWSVRGASGPGPHGDFWQAMVALDELSQATVESAGVLAQSNAVQFGQDNRARAAFLMPLVPAIPAKRGRFMDFQPVLQGKTGVRDDVAFFSRTGGAGGAIPDFAGTDSQHRMGPWARLFKWRHANYRHEGGTWVPGTGPTINVRGTGGGQVNPGGRTVGSSVIQRGRSPGGHWTGRRRILTGYTAYGPYHWALDDHIDWYANDHGYDHQTRRPAQMGKVSDSFFTSYLDTIAKTKLTYMFGSKTPKTIHVPVWKIDYQQCRQIAADPTNKISQTMFYQVEVVSSVPEDSPKWMTPGTFRTNGEYPISVRTNGWVDPQAWGVPKIEDHIWKDTWTYETTQDRSIGLAPKTPDPDDPDPDIFHTVYVVQWYMFGGIDVGGETEISDPCNWDEYDQAPAPIILDPAEGDYDPQEANPDEGYRRKWFMYLGLARGGILSGVWGEQFRNPNPTGSMMTVAQAKVFNNTSWDLWTQDWRVRLAPVTKWDLWTQDLGDAAAAGGMGGTVPQDELVNAYNYLSSLGARAAELHVGH